MEFSKVDHIPTDQVRADILDTEKELKDYRDEAEVLNRNPIQNRLRLYMLSARMSEMKAFIEKLEKLLHYRGTRDGSKEGG